MRENETLRREGYGPAGLVVGQRGARTRQRIVAETLRLFEAQGFHATSVDSIAKAVGMSRSTLYQYFESKEQIFIELLDECGAALMRVVRRIGPLGATRVGFDNLHWWLGEWAYVYDKYATMFVQWATVNTSGTRVRSLVTGFNQAYNERIARQLDSSGITGLDPVDAAVALSAIVHRFNYFRHLGYVPPRNADELLDGLAVCVQLMLFPDTPAEAFDTIVRPADRAPAANGTSIAQALATAGTTAALPNRLAELRPRAAATVRRLLDAGVALFAELGYHGTGVDDVVAKAGFARGTFYKYFDEKLDLLLELARECGAEIGELIPRFGDIDPVGDGPTLRAWLRDYVSFYHRYLGVLRAWLEGDFTDPRLMDTLRAVTRDMHAAAMVVFHRVRRGYPLDLDVASTVLGAILERIPEATLQHDPNRGDEDIVELTARVIERSLLGLGSAGPAR